MEWRNPESLYFILPLCIGWLGLALYSQRRRQRAREAFAARTMWDRIFPVESPVRFWCKLSLRELAIIAGLVAIAGPRFGTEVEEVVPRGSDLYVLIDVSRSMLAEDVVPSRLGRAKADVASLVNRVEGERMGLIAFAGQAVVKCPLTVDYDSFRRALQELDPGSAPRGGTAIGDAIRKALEVFQAKVDRDQSILLITDGDDQQSYPLEAAAVAAERKVTIYTVGLGDADRGARVPQKANDKNFVEYQGEQVWSKLDGSLLSEIALKTSGIYVPAGTKSYDLGELYRNHLQNRRASAGETQQRVRGSEQFQIFLAIAFASLLLDYCIFPFRSTTRVMGAGKGPPVSSNAALRGNSVVASVAIYFAVLNLNLVDRAVCDEPQRSVRDGLRLYSQENYGAAQEKFASAVKKLEESNSETLAIAAFDSACAYHRKGETEKARESYLRAGLSQDRSIATAAHFNLGNLSAEQARTQAGEQPELLPADKRQEVFNELLKAAAAYRHCLELQSDHAQARRNLELVRLWVKFYTDKWREIDRQKRRDESNLLQFLEYLMQTQNALSETVTNLPANLNADGFAELKQIQDELSEEIPALRDKISTTLRPPAPTGNTGPGPEADNKEIEDGIRLLQSWADAAEQQMSTSSKHLAAREPADSIKNQQMAVEELDKIWTAVIPFHPLLAKDLVDQAKIATTLAPSLTQAEKDSQSATVEPEGISKVDESENAVTQTETQPQQFLITDNYFNDVAKSQEQTLVKTRLLVPKAEMELQQLESAPPVDGKTPEQKAVEDSTGLDATNPNATQPDAASGPNQANDPEAVKEGLRKAIELAPQAVEQMETVLESLKQKKLNEAASAAEEARRILEEIQKSQPKNQQPNQENQDQDKKEQQNQQQNDNQTEQDMPQNEKESKDKQGEKPKETKPDEKQQEQPKQEDKSDKQSKPQVSPERLAEALRKVRERQQEKQDRDRQMRAQVLGRAPVDKDW